MCGATIISCFGENLDIFMDIEVNVYRKLQNWYDSYEGNLVYQSQYIELKDILPNCFGYHLFQLEGPKNLDWLQNSPIGHKVLGRFEYPELTFEDSQIVIPYDQIPIQENSLDVIILPHSLDFYPDPSYLLKALVAPLMPEGSIIIFGFNPYSLLMIERWFQCQSLFEKCNFLSSSNICKMLQENQCEIEQVKTFAFRPLLKNKSAMKKLRFLETLGSTCCPSLGCIYMIVARKRVETLTPLRLKNNAVPIISKKNVPVTTQRSIK